MAIFRTQSRGGASTSESSNKNRMISFIRQLIFLKFLYKAGKALKRILTYVWRLLKEIAE